LQNPKNYEQTDPRELYRRLANRGLSRRSLSVLRELAEWRERLAIERNVPRSAILKDDILVELSRRSPTTPEQLREFRLMPAGLIARNAREIVEAVRKGLEGPYPEIARRASPEEPPPEYSSVVRLLEAWLRERARESEIAPEMLATRKELESLVMMHLNKQPEELEVLSGWRAEIAGKDLLRLLEGKISLSVDPATLKIVSKPAKSSPDAG
jgi:ribonuclease D